MDLGQRLDRVRELCKVTPEEMASYCGLTRNYISAIERGINKCNANTLIKYAQKLNISLDKLTGLFEEEGENIDPELKKLLIKMDYVQQQKVLEMIRIIEK